MKLKQLIDSLNEIVESAKTEDIDVFLAENKRWSFNRSIEEIAVYKKYDNNTGTIAYSVVLFGEDLSKNSDDQD